MYSGWAVWGSIRNPSYGTKTCTFFSWWVCLSIQVRWIITNICLHLASHRSTNFLACLPACSKPSAVLFFLWNCDDVGIGGMIYEIRQKKLLHYIWLVYCSFPDVNRYFQALAVILLGNTKYYISSEKNPWSSIFPALLSSVPFG